MALTKINESSSCKITLTFRNENNELFTPTMGTIKIIDVKSGTVIREALAFTPTSYSYTFTVSAYENRILNRKNIIETRKVYITFTYSGTLQGTDEYDYEVRNLKGIT